MASKNKGNKPAKKTVQRAVKKTLAKATKAKATRRKHQAKAATKPTKQQQKSLERKTRLEQKSINELGQRHHERFLKTMTGSRSGSFVHADEALLTRQLRDKARKQRRAAIKKRAKKKSA